MKREVSNVIRYIMDECIPPVIRDSRWFMLPFFYLAYNAKDAKRMMHFKSQAATMSPEDFAHLYKNLNSISRRRQTDLTEKIVQKILDEVAPATTVLDVGCGNGYLLKKLQTKGVKSAAGVDFTNLLQNESISFSHGDVTQLPFDNKSFDTVICTHVLEHVPNLDKAISELYRVAKEKIIIVVPKQLQYYYTLDEHLHFFPYKELLTSKIKLTTFSCKNHGGDWLYIGMVSQ